MKRNRRWVRSLLAVTAAGVLAGSAGVAQAATGDGSGAVVRTDSGPVRGTVAPEYRTFQKVPFAAPPTGELRWRSPQPSRPWSEPRDATKPSSPCAQAYSGDPRPTDEDCLYLNVTTPRSAGHGRPKPVMVWLHGGGNSYGTAADFDAQRLATRGDVVVVTTNYRQGVFGFLAHPGLAGSGAFGLEDQQAALRWVRRNAAAFGGDPGNVTLFGESGGAFDVCAQLTAPGARGLFHRAIAQSGSCATTWPANGIVYGQPASSPWLSLARSEANGVAFAGRFGCADPATAAACLRRVPAAELAKDPETSGLTTVAFGTRVLPENPPDALRQGRFHRVPVMWGTTRDEGRLSAAYSPQPFTEEQYQRMLGEAFGEQASRVAARYPSSAYGSPALAWSAVATNRVWSCPQLTDDRLLAGRTPVYTYEFADRNAPQGYFRFPPDLPSGAFHFSEVPYLFDVVGFAAKFTPEQQRLADRMIGYWTRFAATGDPNGRDLPKWSPFRNSNAQSLAPGDGGIRPVDLAAEHDCGFWATLR
ncbi:carboxylesterase/lipase family protein [Amycolatopsis anabasis]|uniref:carboxylesterase/lipase family protein n=1 Tax=Amycolatopsis anabasis TaxID=1840409 RepID=UPI001C550B2A|nr:carboxylesterase family protein [Amycolatopsis anabasis]